MQITSGKIQKAQRIVIYGPEGIGKSTLANQFPAPIFIDTEGSTNWMNVNRIHCNAWQHILDAVRYLKTEKHDFKTAVFDTADWADRYCIQSVCNNANKNSIESFGYGKGYTYLMEEFARLLTSLDALIDSGMHVIFVAHCTVKKMELPDEAGSFDHYEFKCTRQISPLLKEWADAVLFVNYKVTVTQGDNQRTKAVGGRKRFILTQHTAAYDAKNRWDLPEKIPFELPFDFGVFAKVLGENIRKPVVETPATTPPEPIKAPAVPKDHWPIGIPPQLGQLMETSEVLVSELERYCEGKNFIPKGGTLSEIKDIVQKQMAQAANWNKVVDAIKSKRESK